MGLFKKIKDIFYDEEIVEVPEKKSKRDLRKENSDPVIQDITPKESIARNKSNELDEKINTFSERELFKTEKTFDFPVFEEEEEAPIRTRSRTNILELQKELEEKSSYQPKKIEPSFETPVNKTSNFRPSPVISPIYGILDKNYKKEEIVEKKVAEKPYVGEMSYDYVRRKAYGTLEDELEDTLTRVNSEIIESVNELEKEIENLPKTSKNIEDLLTQIEKSANTSSVSIGELEEEAKDKMMAEEENEEILESDEITEFKISEEPKEEMDNTLEHDLFNLIDSMYEDKEE